MLGKPLLVLPVLSPDELRVGVDEVVLFLLLWVVLDLLLGAQHAPAGAHLGQCHSFRLVALDLRHLANGCLDDLARRRPRLRRLSASLRTGWRSGALESFQFLRLENFLRQRCRSIRHSLSADGASFLRRLLPLV